MKLFKYLKFKDYIAILFVLIFVCIQVFLDLKIPEYMSEITTIVQTGGELSKIIKQGLLMLGCAFLGLLFSIIVTYLVVLISSNFSKTLRNKLFNKVQSFNLEEIKKFKTSSLITRTTNDINNVEMLLSFGLQMILKAPITAIWAISKIYSKSFEWTIATAIAVVILLTVVTILMILVIPNFKKVQKLIDNINGLMQENLKGIKVIRAFNAENYQNKKFASKNNELTNIQLFNQKTMGIMQPFIFLIMNGVAIAIYAIGAILISNAAFFDKITLFSDMIVFSSYAIQVIMSFLMLAMVFLMYPRSAISATRINEVLNTFTKITNGNVKNSKIKGTIEFKNVYFKYPDSDEYVLENISFKVETGEVLAIIGSTGSGKSSIINLILRFYDATKGEILINDINIKEYDLHHLHEIFGYVSQKAMLFKGSIKHNVLYGKINKDNILDTALKISQSSTFVNKLENKEHYEVAQGGINLSGGQKQRLSIARAIAKNPEIYLFDDSFSALDYATDFNLRKELKKHTSSATNIIVAQRIGTIINSDKILVLEKGKVVGLDNHKNLLNKCLIYKEIAYSQLSKEELENA